MAAKDKKGKKKWYLLILIILLIGAGTVLYQTDNLPDSIKSKIDQYLAHIKSLYQKKTEPVKTAQRYKPKKAKPRPREKPKPSVDAGVTISAYLGSYTIRIAQYRGILRIWTKKGKHYGTVKFLNWGKGATEYVKNVSVRNSQIYFVRSITTEAERKRTGATRYFTQRYYGRISGDRRVIQGHYNDAGAEVSWTATRR
jgi:hypothetical protein